MQVCFVVIRFRAISLERDENCCNECQKRVYCLCIYIIFYVVLRHNFVLVKRHRFLEQMYMV